MTKLEFQYNIEKLTVLYIYSTYYYGCHCYSCINTLHKYILFWLFDMTFNFKNYNIVTEFDLFCLKFF